MTYKEIVSEFVNTMRTANKDNKRPRRYILKLLKDASAFLIAQKLGERGLSKETDLYTTIECFEFERVVAKDCPSITFRRCDILMRSKRPLPKLVFSNMGASIREVVSLDGDYRFKIIDENQYRVDKKRKYSYDKDVSLYVGTDNHVYIPEKEIYSLDLTVLTLDKETVEDCSGCSEDKSVCKNNWDYEFVMSPKLLEGVKNMVYQKLGMNRQIVEDQNPNNLENG